MPKTDRAEKIIKPVLMLAMSPGYVAGFIVWLPI